MEPRGGTLAGSLELASAFSTQINTGVPVELVEAENRADAVLSTENGGQNISAEDTMEISVEGDAQGLDSTQLSAAPRSVPVELPSQAAASENMDMSIPAISGITTSSNLSETPGTATTQLVGMSMPPSGKVSTQSQNLFTSSNFPSGLPSSNQNPHTSQLTQTVIEQLSEAQGLEISSDAITSMSVSNNTLSSGSYSIPQIASFSGAPNTSSLMASRGHRDLLSGNISYGDLDLSVGANTTGIDSSVLNEPDSPSSPESNFDSSELLSNPLSQQDEVTQRLAQAGPIGVAAAAAIMSGSRKRKRQHTFETNPSFRKRHCSKLTKKLKETIDELAARVGLQAVVVTYRPGKGNGKNEPSFKVFGAAPLVNIVKNQHDAIVNEMEAALHQQAPPIPVPPPSHQGEPLYDLPPLIFDGIPTPVHKMTQAQLRTFIPNMLKYSTGRGKPGWGKDDVRPPWWPDDVPWANVRSDMRTAEQKKALQWTDALRRIVINCYLHHGRMDLLPEFSIDQLQQYLTPQVAEQLQVQLDNLQQQQESAQPANGNVSLVPSTADSAADEVAAALTEITEASGGVEGRDDPEMMVGDNQQVFTVDTGLGNCDMTGMPTLADASLAETAARLQQVADETGEVQYATQTVTVTDRDAKALCQPVGSTTTVLLTAYPGGHSGATGTAAPSATGERPRNPSSDSSNQHFLTTQPNTAGNVQVVYSASHIDSMPDNMPSNDYLNPAAGQDIMLQHSRANIDANIGGSSEGTDSSSDLAAQLIREYSMSGDSLRKESSHMAPMRESGEVKNSKSPES